MVAEPAVVEEAVAEEGAVVVAEEAAVVEAEAATGVETLGAESELEVVPVEPAAVGGDRALLLSARALIDGDFENRDGQVSGEIENILIDLTDGRVLFVTLEYGGFLGLGNKQLPVPLRALRWGPEEELLLNFDEARLQALPDLGNEWPDLQSAAWDDDIVAFWRDTGFDPGFSFENTTSIIMRASNVMELTVGDIGLGMGEIEDLLIDLGESRIKYVILTYGPLLGDRLIAVPFRAFNVQVFQGDVVLGANLEAPMLAEAPQFDRTTLDTARFNQTLDEEIDAYWRQRGVITE